MISDLEALWKMVRTIGPNDSVHPREGLPLDDGLQPRRETPLEDCRHARPGRRPHRLLRGQPHLRRFRGTEVGPVEGRGCGRDRCIAGGSYSNVSFCANDILIF